MELSLITPIAHLEYTKLLPGRFAIAPIALKSDSYCEYFAQAAKDGYKVILDNGVFENDKVSDDEYIALAQDLKPSVLIIPDTINGPALGNWHDAQHFINQLDDVAGVQLMFVPQCAKNADDGFWTVLDCAINHPAIAWIGICRDAVYNAFGQYTGTKDQELNRFYFAAELQTRYTIEQILSVKWHFLGMGNRFDMLPYFWFVDSMDTACLFYQSTLNNQMTSQYILPGNLKRPKDYFMHDFKPHDVWAFNSLLQKNCSAALEMAQKADVMRREILGGRL